MARSSSNVDVMMRLRGARKFKREVEQAGKSLEDMGLKGAGAMAKFANQSDRLKNFGKSWTTKVTLPIVAGLGLSIKAASDWESAFANVRKTVDTNEAGFARLERGIRDMAMEIPVSTGDLAELAGTAGQLGIAEKNILGFTRVMADLGVATDLVGEAGATTMARFANNMRMPQDQFDRLGSSVVALGNTLPATESEIMNMASRLSASSARIGLAEHEVLGWGAALASLDVKAEAGGTAMSTVFNKMGSAAISGGKDLKQFSKVAGMSADDFRKLFQDDANAAVFKFVEGLKNIHEGGGDMVTTLKDMGLGGLRITDTLGRAAGGLDLVSDALGTGAKGWDENKALAEEAEQRYKTFEGQMQILKNVFTEIGIVFAENLLPHLSKFVQWLGPKITGVVDTFKSMPKEVQVAAGVLVGLLAAIGPVAWGLGLIAGAVGKWLILGAKLIPIIKGLAWATKIWTFWLLANPITWVVLGIAALVVGLVYAYHKVEWFRNAVDAIWDAIEGGAKAVIGWLKSNWQQVLFVLVAPIVALPYYFIRNFDEIIGFIGGVGGKIASAAVGMWDGLKDEFQKVFDWITRKADSLKSAVTDAIPKPLRDALGVSADVAGAFGRGFGIPGLATGGRIVTGGSVLVGEHGPELVGLPPAATVAPLSSDSLRDGISGLIEIVLHSNLYVDGERMAGSTARHVADAGARA